MNWKFWIDYYNSCFYFDVRNQYKCLHLEEPWGENLVIKLGVKEHIIEYFSDKLFRNCDEISILAVCFFLNSPHCRNVHLTIQYAITMNLWITVYYHSITIWVSENIKGVANIKLLSKLCTNNKFTWAKVIFKCEPKHRGPLLCVGTFPFFFIQSTHFVHSSLIVPWACENKKKSFEYLLCHSQHHCHRHLSAQELIFLFRIECILYNKNWIINCWFVPKTNN